MSFRAINARYLEPGAMLLMVIGIIALCQPWIAVLHTYSVLLMLLGLIGFNITAHVPPEPAKETDNG
jgi:hypothetical protein